MRSAPAALALGLLAPLSLAEAAEPMSSTTPYDGVTYSVWAESSIPARIHVLEIDLTSAELELRATAENQRGQKISEYAESSDSQIVINGDFFAPADFKPAGLARGNGTTWSNTADDESSGFVSFYKGVGGTISEISPPEQAVQSVGSEVIGVVGGRPMVARAGLALSTPDCDDLVAMPCERAPRTAVALSEDTQTMWLVVVDGWQAGSDGMTAVELGTFLAQDLDAHNALMLDGGGSSSMFIEAEGGVVNTPSDGVERSVANHLGVHHGALSPGTLQGVVREGGIDGPDIDGAVVELDDGTTTTFTEGTLWQLSVAPRWACVTGRAEGYLPRTECRQVPSGDSVYASIFLQPGTPADAGPGPADAAPIPDAPPGIDPDGGMQQGSGDAGIGGGAGGGCGCRGASSSGGTPLLVLVVILFAFHNERRFRHQNRHRALH